MKKIYLSFFALICFLAQSHAKYACTQADLIISNVTITNVDGNNFEYTFDVKNTGYDLLYLDRMYFQTYLSADNVLGSGDPAAGGSIFNPSAPPLAHNETYTVSWYYHFSNPVNLTNFPYLIITAQESYGQTMPECDVTNNSAVKYIGCNLAELTISNVTILNVDGNTFNYTFEITNTGWDTLYLDRMYFQTYLSADNVLNSGDPAAGGSIFGTSAPALAKGQTYTASWYYNPTTPVNLTNFPYLIITAQAYYGQTMPECDLTNNTAVKYIGCNLAELTFSNVNILNVDGNTFNYTFEITNTGWGTLYLNRMYFQTYLSADNVLNAGDVAAGGSIFGASAPALAKGQSYTASWYYNPTTPVNLTNFPYLIITAQANYGQTMPECDLTNNTTVKYIGCNLAELTIGKIAITNRVGNEFDYTFEIKNTGWGTLYLDRMMFQTYLSADDVINAGDAAAGGSIFGASAPALARGETYIASWYYHPSIPVNLKEYPNLIIQIRTRKGYTMPECNTDNNTAVKNVFSKGIKLLPLEPQFTIESTSARLHQSYPNPASSTAAIPYFVPETMKGSKIAIHIYDYQGALVTMLDKLTTGEQEVKIEKGKLKPGIYYCKFIINGKLIETKRMIITE